MRTVLVTGASRGIGHATARVLVETGHRVIAVYRRAPGDLTSLPPAGIEVVQADLTTREGRTAVIQACVETPVAAVVHAAGVAVRADFEEVDSELGDPIVAQLDTDLEAPLLLTRGLLRAGALGPHCSVVFVSSNLARHGLAGKVAYGAAKAGIEGAVRGLARELGPRGIRVNGVAPGLILTDMTRDRPAAALRAYADEVPLRRIGTPEDVAPVIAYLAGSDAGFVSGQVLDVDGGWGL